jgi:curved DNA-binding protein CbpA
MDPYQTLGIEPSATADEVAKAYRRKAKQNHPDRGGEVNDFHAIQRCYDLLSDQQAKAEYDRTGSWESKKPNQQVSVVAQLINAAFMTVVPPIINQGGDPTKIDILELIRSHISKPIADMKKQQVALKKAAEGLKKIRDRFKATEGENLLKAIADNQVNVCEDGLRGITEQINIQEQALELLKRFSYEFEKPKFSETILRPSGFMPTFTQIFVDGK